MQPHSDRSGARQFGELLKVDGRPLARGGQKDGFFPSFKQFFFCLNRAQQRTGWMQEETESTIWDYLFGQNKSLLFTDGEEVTQSLEDTN